jgi:hypothetical protein
MEPPRARTAIAQLLALIHTCPNAQAVTLLVRSIHVWLAYYPSLQTVLGGYSPAIVAFMHDEFYAFARLVLDGMAATFWSFFGLSWSGVAVSHTHLTQEFPRFCATYRFQGDTADLAARMHDLHARIIARESADASQDAFTRSRDTRIDLFTCLDQYIVAMCVFLTANLVHSVLSSTPREDQA